MTPGGNTRRIATMLFAVLALFTVLRAQPAANPQRTGDYTFSGPYTYKNLNVYLVHGKDQGKAKGTLTLQEAMKKKIVKVYETGSVNELSIENLSKDKEIFVQSGDIVHGGRQDRVLSYDLLLPPKSGKIPIASFCVESGRWTKRGDEPAGEFTSSNNQLAGRELKLAAKYDNEQTKVWGKVAETQKKLSDNLGVRVNSSTSETSMELALGNSKVKETSEEYVKALNGIINGKNDVIGFAFAVNGKVSSADVYSSNALFTKLWPKLLNASAVEAIADMNSADSSSAAPTEVEVRDVLADPDKGEAQNTDVNSRVRVVRQQTKNNVLFETRDRNDNDAWVHRSYIRLE